MPGIETHLWIMLLAISGVLLASLGWLFARQASILRVLGQLAASQKSADQALHLVLEQFDHRLREEERELHRQLTEARAAIIERMVRSHHLQQKSSHELQQHLLARYGQIYQALERRFGEMQQNLTEDAGRLRTDLLQRFEGLRRSIVESLAEGSLGQQRNLSTLAGGLRDQLQEHRGLLERRHAETLESQQRLLRETLESLLLQVAEALRRNSQDLGERLEGLTQSTEQRLGQISMQVQSQLNAGFAKTTDTFNRVLTHLTRIDEAQKKITELSSNVISLQEILADKRSRGAFGEVQLNSLVQNLMPKASYAFQHTLEDGARVDCILFLPEPTGKVAIDAKFPLESYQRMTDLASGDTVRAAAGAQFRRDIRRHIRDIAEKYIRAGETSDGAVMFIPAEAVFAEIHAHFPDLVEEAHRRRVWLVSPTTMMAILTTARAVIKDAATRDQVHVIQKHLHDLAGEFQRFQLRMDNLARHIRQASKDVDDVNLSARKISGRFRRIEQVDFGEEGASPALPSCRNASANPADPAE